MTEPVYHYTDSHGIKGIIENASLWLTHADYLNDAQEAKIGRQLGLGMLEGVALGQVTGASDLVRTIAKVAIERIEQSDKYPIGPEAHLPNGIFIASFSAHSNDLSQYRAYSTTNARYCIGFNREKLDDLALASSLDFSGVTYDFDHFKQNLLLQFIGSAEAMIQQHRDRQYHPDNPVNWHYPDIPDMVDALLRKNVPLVKHGSFYAEKEHRLHTRPRSLWIYLQSESLLFRTGPRGLTPYISQSLSSVDQPIVSITIGPSEAADSALDAVRLLIHRRKALEARSQLTNKLFADNLVTKTSGIPFRG